MENPPPAPVRPSYESTRPVEPLKSSEREPISPHFRALHGRILLGGGTLNPDNKNISPVTKEALTNGSPQILNECATSCRRKEATVGKDQLEEEINSRVAKNTLVLKQDLSNIKDFDQAKATRWQATLTKLFGKDAASATEAEVRALFDKYFYSKDKLGNNSDTDLFSEDVMEAFDGDLAMVEENADCIIWYARICGFTQDYSETVFKHQITAKVLLKNQPDQLVAELNQKKAEGQPSRINDINEDEEQVLEFIWGNRGKLETSPTKTEPPEPKPDETPPKTKTEDKKILAKKAEYQSNKEKLTAYLTDSKTSLEKVNLYLKNLDLKEITKEGLTEIQTDEEERKILIIDIILGQERLKIEDDNRDKIAKDLWNEMSEPEKQQVNYYNLSKQVELLNAKLAKVNEPDQSETSGELIKQINELKDHHLLELNKIPKNIADGVKNGDLKPEEILEKINKIITEEISKLQPEITREIDDLRQLIYKWEGIEDKDEGDPSDSDASGKKPDPTDTTSAADKDSPEGKEKNRKPSYARGLLDKLKARIANRTSGKSND